MTAGRERSQRSELPSPGCLGASQCGPGWGGTGSGGAGSGSGTMGSGAGDSGNGDDSGSGIITGFLCWGGRRGRRDRRRLCRWPARAKCGVNLGASGHGAPSCTAPRGSCAPLGASISTALGASPTRHTMIVWPCDCARTLSAAAPRTTLGQSTGGGLLPPQLVSSAAPIAANAAAASSCRACRFTAVP